MGCAARPAVLFVAVGLATATAMAQPPQKLSERPPIRARVELVNVDVFVTDRRGHFVSGLTREHFRIFDEGVPQPITHFASLETPARVLILLETGPAVYLLHPQHLAAAGALLDGLGPDDEVALASYDDTFRLWLGFTRDRAAVRGQLAALSYRRGMAELRCFDAVAAALDWLAPYPGKKALVLLSTGLDATGAARWTALEPKLQAASVVIFALALGGELRGFSGERTSEASGLSFAAADRALRRMAEMTAGQAFFPRGAEEFVGIYRQIAVQLRHHYSLAFPPPQRDGRYHRLQVQLLDAQGRSLPLRGRTALRVRARPGYLAPGP
ncbi:MAG: VWA domain-containing protein [Firmicutes bacterium]|nr:VWA domain-containing protein [Bacillota bacterium]